MEKCFVGSEWPEVVATCLRLRVNSPMLFERQRLLLTLLEALREPVGHTDFQKLLFLYTKECEETPTYEFVPYRFGCCLLYTSDAADE